MPWIVYETRNLVTGSIYVGVLKTTRSNAARYLGSGRALRRAIEKYGKENFKRTTLIKCDTAEEAYLIEAAVVDDDWIEREENYNIKTGGWGGHGHTMSDEAKEKIRQYRLTATEANAKISKSLTGRRLTEEHKRNLSESAKRAQRKGRVCTEETRRLISERQKAAWARGRKCHKGDAT
jgi:hypothetical protein